MRLVFWAAAIAALAIVAFAAAMRTPFVQDRLFARALDRAFAENQAALFGGEGLNVVFCGTGSPLPSAQRAQACTGVIAGDQMFLVDVGTGSWETIQAAGIPGSRLGGVFLTHFHTDHIGDLAEANLGSWVTGRPAPLPVYGPAGVARVVAGVNEMIALDDLYRTAHHGKAVAPPRAAGLSAVPFEGGAPSVVYEANGLKVTAFPVDHAPVTPAVGYKFERDGRSVVISGDTAYTEELVEQARGTDLLIHEAQANHMVDKMREAAAAAGAATIAKIFADIPTYHTSPVEAAQSANQAGADWLVLTHLTPAADNAVARRIFMRGVSKVRRSNVTLAEDGMVVHLPRDGAIEFSSLD